MTTFGTILLIAYLSGIFCISIVFMYNAVLCTIAKKQGIDYPEEGFFFGQDDVDTMLSISFLLWITSWLGVAVWLLFKLFAKKAKGQLEDIKAEQEFRKIYEAEKEKYK